MYKRGSKCQSETFTVPWLNYHLVGVIYISVWLFPVDVLQNINSWHPIPLGQVKLPAWLKVFLGENMVFNEEHRRLQNVTQH